MSSPIASRDELIQAAKRQCQEAEELLKQAKSLKDAKQKKQSIVKAITIYTHVLKMNLDIPEPYLGIAFLSLSSGDYKKALNLLAQAKKIAPFNARVNIMITRTKNSIKELEVKELSHQQVKVKVRRLRDINRQEIEAAKQKKAAKNIEKQVHFDLSSKSEEKGENKTQKAPKSKNPGSQLPEKISSNLGLKGPANIVHEGVEVTALQSVLIAQGYQLKANGNFDKLTYAAVRLFQMKHKITINGLVEEETRNLINPLLTQISKERSLRTEIFKEIKSFRHKRSLPVEEIWKLILRHKVQDLIKSIQKPAKTRNAPYQLPPPTNKTLISSILGTMGQMGMTNQGLEVQRLKEFLNANGFQLILSEHFDINTFTAVKEYQQKHSLPPTGIVNEDLHPLINSYLKKRYEEEHVVEKLTYTLRDFRQEIPLVYCESTHIVTQHKLRDSLFVTTTQIKTSLGPPKHPAKFKSEGLEVAILQDFLKKQGYSIKVTRVFDQATQQSLIRWQKNKQLPPNGLLSGKSITTINALLAPPDKDKMMEVFEKKKSETPEELAEAGPIIRLKSNLGPQQFKRYLSEGEEINLLQKSLKYQGFKLKVSGVFDKETMKAVKTYQMRKKLPITGTIEKTERKFLNRVLEKMESESKSEKQKEFDVETFSESTTKESSDNIYDDLGLPEQKGAISEGPQIILLKQVLINQGYKMELNETFDKVTYAAVRKFQIKHKIPISGIVEKKTRNILNPMIKIAQLEEIFFEQLFAEIQAIRQENGVPTKGVWIHVLKSSLREFLTLVKEKIPDEAASIPPPETIERPFLQSTLGTPGQINITSEGPEVLKLHEVLWTEGFTEINLDSTFNIQTFTALKQFQLEKGLQTTGVTDENTRKAINQILEKRYQEEESRERIEQIIIKFQNDISVKNSEDKWTCISDKIEEICYDNYLCLNQELGPFNRADKISEGVEVTILQYYLIKEDFDVKISGIYDNNTYNSIRDLQKKHQLPPSGMLDNKTRTFINNHLNTVLKE